MSSYNELCIIFKTKTLKKIIILLILTSFFLSCKEKLNEYQKYEGRRYSIKFARDTISKGEMTKALLHLAAPYYDMEKSKIVVFIEQYNDIPLNENLQNYQEIPKIGFHNLEWDIENRKWSSSQLDYKRTSYLGKKLDSIGWNKIRGFILEYYEGDPLLDSIFDYSKTKQYYFEKDIYVRE